MSGRRRFVEFQAALPPPPMVLLDPDPARQGLASGT